MNAGLRARPLDDHEALVRARLGDADRRPEVIAEQSQRCRQVWEAVILQAIEDALSDESRIFSRTPAAVRADRARAIDWLSGGQGFGDVCERAGRNPDITRRRVREYLASRGVILAP